MNKNVMSIIRYV